jgi:hypothetical protein
MKAVHDRARMIGLVAAITVGCWTAAMILLG